MLTYRLVVPLANISRGRRQINILLMQSRRTFLSNDDNSEEWGPSSFIPTLKQEPIKFKTQKNLNFNAHRFFRVVYDVDSCQKFIDFMPRSVVDKGTYKDSLGKLKKTIHGEFDATTTIGFNAVSFDYVSKVRYSHPVVPVNFYHDARNIAWRVTSVADGSRIFNSMKSEWKIRPNVVDPLHKCIVDYKIEMEFASSIYAGVTSKFFDFLVDNINK